MLRLVTVVVRNSVGCIHRPPHGVGVGAFRILICHTILARAATTERKSTSVATNRHSSGTDQHLDMDEEGRRRSERNRTRQTAAAGPPRLPATGATGTGSTSLGGSDDATTSQDGVADQDSERFDTDTVGQRIPLAGPANVPPTIQTGLYGPTGDQSGLQTIVQEAVQAAVRGAVAGMADLLRPVTQRTHDPRPPAESGKLVPVPDLPPRSLVLWAKESVVIPPNYRRAMDLLEPIKAEDVRTGPQLCPDLWRRYHLTTEDGPIMRTPFKTRPIWSPMPHKEGEQSRYVLHHFLPRPSQVSK
ncbi:hypothetical protein HPB47_009871 [Ixodes persulcatus]|uniref:Uncharacterized protein n=1 Tax=Ixodes persulcatus TaxID=34615 RepID=A0AC60P0Q0_IXOPE|nr:hypothetical protein HPB47_009871 [Ixodes persulcatus]